METYLEVHLYLYMPKHLNIFSSRLDYFTAVYSVRLHSGWLLTSALLLPETSCAMRRERHEVHGRDSRVHHIYYIVRAESQWRKLYPLGELTQSYQSVCAIMIMYVNVHHHILFHLIAG